MEIKWIFIIQNEEKLNVLYTIDDKEFPSMDYINVLEKMERL